MSQFNIANHRRRGWASVALLTALAGSAAFILIYHENGSKGIAVEPGCGGCQLPDGAKGGLIGRPGPTEDEWCVTQQKYEAYRLENPVISPMADCSPLGPPDDPAIRDDAIPTETTPIRTYRLSFHVFQNDDGSNAAASSADVQTAVDRLNTNYAPWKIAFTYESRFINSTKYRTLADSEESGMKRAYALSPTTKLNIYVVDTGGVCWGTFPWTSSALSKLGGVVMDDTWFGITTTLPSILSHEVGHCLGLWHTFHGVDEVTSCSGCYEQAGRSAADGDTKGDFCSDTNPTLRSATACSDPAGLDPCSGNPWVDTPYQNFMSYSNRCAVEFTPHQAGRMHAWTTQTLTGWLELPPPPNAPGTPTLSNSGGTVTITWADNSPDESGFEVQREKKAKGNSWGSQTTVATVGANVTSTTNAPGSGTFRYRVRSFNGNGPSAWSGWTQITL